MEQEKKKQIRDWHRRNFWSLLVCLVVLLSLVAVNVKESGIKTEIGTDREFIEVYQIGFPAFYLESDHYNKLSVYGNWHESHKYVNLRIGWATLNVLFAAVVVTSTWILFIRIPQRISRLQFSIRSIMILTALIGVALPFIIAEYEDAVYQATQVETLAKQDSRLIPYLMYVRLSWHPLYFRIPILIGCGCTLYLCLRMLWRGVKRISQKRSVNDGTE